MSTTFGALKAKRDHRWTKRRARMSAYVDDELRTRQRRRLEAHAAICPECGPVLRTLVVLVAKLRNLRRHPTQSIADDVIRRVRASGPPPA